MVRIEGSLWRKMAEMIVSNVSLPAETSRLIHFCISCTSLRPAISAQIPSIFFESLIFSSSSLGKSVNTFVKVPMIFSGDRNTWDNARSSDCRSSPLSITAPKHFQISPQNNNLFMIDGMLHHGKDEDPCLLCPFSCAIWDLYILSK